MLNDPCKGCGTIMIIDWRKDYFTRRTKELIYCSLKCTQSNRKNARARVDKQEDNINCERCGRIITEDWRTDSYNKRYVPLRWCSRGCSNARTLSADTRQQIKQSLAIFYKEHPRVLKQKTNTTLIECIKCKTNFTSKIYKDKVKEFCSLKCKVASKIHTKECIQCGTNFLAKSVSGKSRKTCSTKCRNMIHSIHRQEYIRSYGSFATERHLFTYKDTTVNVDSKLERAAIIYMVDNLKATRIERYNNLINYRDGDAHRTFNPDFICYINNKTHIVEVKQLWRGDQSHLYAKNIPLKREALKSFCDSKGYNMIWLDFNEAPVMKDIYRDILNLKSKTNK